MTDFLHDLLPFLYGVTCAALGLAGVAWWDGLMGDGGERE